MVRVLDTEAELFFIAENYKSYSCGLEEAGKISDENDGLWILDAPRIIQSMKAHPEMQEEVVKQPFDTFSFEYFGIRNGEFSYELINNNKSLYTHASLSELLDKKQYICMNPESEGKPEYALVVDSHNRLDKLHDSEKIGLKELEKGGVPGEKYPFPYAVKVHPAEVSLSPDELFRLMAAGSLENKEFLDDVLPGSGQDGYEGLLKLYVSNRILPSGGFPLKLSNGNVIDSEDSFFADYSLMRPLRLGGSGGIEPSTLDYGNFLLKADKNFGISPDLLRTALEQRV